jgi:tripartite-type tricarboxylate transporter receptor subunit TctC
MTSKNGISRRGALGLGLALALSTVTASAATAQSRYPEKPITLVVPLSAGGPTDILGRALAKALEPILGQQVIVENRTGAGGQVAYEYAVKQPADGYTLIMNTVSVTVLPVTNPTFRLNAATDFSPVTMFEERGTPFIARADAPFKTFEEFIANAKEHPGEINFAVGGAADELGAAWLDQAAGIKTERIRYAGAAPSVLALLSGEADIHQTFLGNVKQHIDQGKLRIIAIGSKERSPLLPDVPAVAEFYPGYGWTSYTGVLTPKGTPQAVIEKVNAAIRKAVEASELKQVLKAQGTAAAPMSPEDYAARLAADIENWARIAKTANLKFN